MAYIYRRGKYYWVGYSEGGRHLQVSLKVTSRDAAKLLLSEYQMREAVSRHRSKVLMPKVSLDALIDEFVETRGRDKTKHWYRWCWGEFKAFCSERNVEALSDVYADVVEGFYASRRSKGANEEKARLVKKPEARPKADPGGAASILRGLKAIFNFAAERHYIHENPASRVKAVKATKKIFRDLTFEEIEALLATAKKHAPSLHAMFATAYYAGLREGELVYLKPDEVHLTKGYLDVKGKPENMIKDHQERRVPLGAKLKSILTAHKPGKKWMFETGDGNSRRHNHRRELRRVAKKAGLDPNGINLRILRESFGSHLRRRGVDIALISQYMGHSSIDVTLRHYAHIRLEETQKEIDKL